MTLSVNAAPAAPAPLHAPAVDPAVPAGDVTLDLTRPHQHFPYDVAIVGLGYVGLPTALAFHAAGRSVVGVDVSGRRLDEIRDLQADLLDTDRDRLAEALREPESFHLTSQSRYLTQARAIIICVPTPVDKYLVPDLSILRAACATVVEHARRDQVVILTSTTYVGSTRDLRVEPLAQRGLVAGDDLWVSFSPERINPGVAEHAHEDVPRVVGGVTPECTLRSAAVLSAYARNVHQVPSPDAAEMVKLAENTFRAVNIALANEFAEICGSLDLPVIDVIDAAATKPYGFMPFYPGPGVGGHCIPCDPHYLLWQLRRSRVRTPLIEEAMAGIATRPSRIVERARETLSLYDRGLRGSRVLVVGVAYKPDVEDIRESPALEILDLLEQHGAVPAFHDPMIERVRLASGRVLENVADPAGHPADLVLLHTRHTGMDLDWTAGTPLLDATYRFAAAHGGHTP